MGRDILVLVTGATDGIGRETAFELARRGATVLLHGRSEDRLKKVRAELELIAHRPMPDPVCADFASLQAVRALVHELEGRSAAPDVLVNNAGIFMRRRELSAEGIELTLAVNHFAPFLLTHLLLAGKAGERMERVVNVSSMAHANGSVDLGDLQGVEGEFEPYAAYSTSKLANVLFTFELARRVASRKICVNALHPGVVATKLLTEGFGATGGRDSLERAAGTSVMLALDSLGERVSGRYFAYEREATASAAAQDRQLARRHYEASAKVAGVDPLPV